MGKMPRNRDHFDPRFFLKSVFGDHKVEVLDSNKMTEGWQEKINKPNSNSRYNWDRLNDQMREHEVSDDTDDLNGDLIDVESMGPDEHEESVESTEGPEKPPSSNKSLPKRVLAYSSRKLLNLFSNCDRGSLDGTFKSCCKLWKQQFVFMLKSNGHWIPVVFGWLPDKTEESYKVFLHLVLEKLKELGIAFNVKEIIVDFELNIHKSIDEMMPEVKILGCFFHLAKAFKDKIEQKKMKMEYENNPKLHKFIKRAVALSSLPLEDIDTGFNWLKENLNFDDPNVESFKDDFLEYVDTYWINGCIPPFIWSTWERDDDWTNNNQEGFNSKMNRELKQQHPSPAILLCFLKNQITSSEYKIAEAKTVVLGPRQQVKHRQRAEQRRELIFNFQEAKKRGGADIKKLVGEYMAIMGQNVITSTMIGRTTDLQESQDLNNVIEVDDDIGNTSSWQAPDKPPSQVLESGRNPYFGRKSTRKG